MINLEKSDTDVIIGPNSLNMYEKEIFKNEHNHSQKYNSSKYLDS